MSTTFNSTDGGAPTQTPLTVALANEEALHHVFNEEFASLYAEAHKVEDETPDVAWQHIMHALHGEAHSPQALANAAAHSRHEAAEHIKVSTRETPLWIPILIGAVVLMGLLGLAAYMTKMSTDAKFARALAQPDLKPIASISAQIANVTRDDGTKVQPAP